MSKTPEQLSPFQARFNGISEYVGIAKVTSYILACPLGLGITSLRDFSQPQYFDWKFMTLFMLGYGILEIVGESSYGAARFNNFREILDNVRTNPRERLGDIKPTVISGALNGIATGGVIGGVYQGLGLLINNNLHHG